MLARSVRKILRPQVIGATQRSFSTALKVEDDLNIKVNGRQSVSGVTATIFGANGFVGRYVVNRLGRIGSQCVIPYRGDGMNVRHLKLMGDLGQIVPIPIDFCDEDSIRVALERSNVVINLIGSQHVTNNYSYHDVNVKCVYRLAKLAAETGNVKKFVHMSCLGADNKSPSEQLRTKAEGEEVVREFFPQATIIRAAPIFGDEDMYLNRLAEWANFSPAVPCVNGGLQKVQPVFVNDVAQCIVNALTSEKAPGATIEAVGPEIFCHANVIDHVCQKIYREDAAAVSIPTPILRGIASVAQKLLPMQRFRLITPDAIDQQQVDLIESKKAGHLKMTDFDVNPRRLGQESSTILMRHRGHRIDPEWVPRVDIMNPAVRGTLKNLK